MELSGRTGRLLPVVSALALGGIAAVTLDALARDEAKVAKPAAVQAANQPPELEYPPYHRVAPGKEIAFGLNIVDQDGDTVSVALDEMPPTAKYDPLTLTVRWKPTAKDVPAGRFKVRLVEVQP